MFSIINCDATITITPFAHLDRVMYALNVSGQRVMTFDTKKAAVELAQVLFGGI